MKIKRSTILTLILDAALMIFLFVVKPIGNLLMEGVSDCIFTKYSLLCPSCGGTRSVYNFFDGNFAISWNYNPFFFIMIIYAFLLIAVLNLRYVFGVSRMGKLIKAKVHPITLVSFVIAFALFGILRNFI